MNFGGTRRREGHHSGLVIGVWEGIEKESTAEDTQ